MFCIAKHGTSRVYKIHLANKLAVEKKMILKDAIYIYIYVCVCVYIYIYILLLSGLKNCTYRIINSVIKSSG